MDLSPVTAAASAVASGVGQATATWDTSHLVALAAALGWASGLRLYAVVFLTGLAGRLGWVPLPEGLQLLQQPLVLGVAGVLLVVEFLADKIPWVDSAWDAVHTVIRIPAGAALAAGVIGADAGQWQLIAALLGGTLAATAHVAKATTRAAVNTSPEPFSNIALSLLGDAAVPAMLWLAWSHPGAFLIVLTLVVLVMAVMTVLLMRFARRAFGRVRQMLSPPAARA
ncbi:DUF4126 domain-containing protein [Ideonella alba]|uniref:DUF4126 domain-containing protein n=1 Tax=Ideonella alba TaxID=2824118 RepID=A0A940YIM0_9BURK|nr:DUF4126 domain-containing protein [Ideonella alba]MBQ0933230.1 DUF4126 domain-containing protein [Ideonella alba]